MPKLIISLIFLKVAGGSMDYDEIVASDRTFLVFTWLEDKLLAALDNLFDHDICEGD